MKTNSREIYLSAVNRCKQTSTETESFDLLVVEHILRAVVEVLTEEQQLKVLEKVK